MHTLWQEVKIRMINLLLSSIVVFLISTDIFLRVGMYYGVRTIFG